ncbi:MULTISPECIES: efflux RND transporter periplasmic adaptor subunit [Methylomicrobium]|uniref:RND family efflux transporter, MFP subunit n=1 Tax=Methylomicrobium album BG8 TaxID=686340 RepID=H8GHZ7_METAL|nr:MULTISPECIES: efflux RND transporter periplasmic adaptor subunit [Methylomicrobium]EIC28981.1 RND family efflux transporter, MFP subunit [Methylomicrobium album BG8]
MTQPLPKKWLFPAAALIALLLLILWMLGLLGGNKTEPGLTPLPTQAMLPQETARAIRQTLRETQAWPGAVKALIEARIAPKISARILEVAFREGDRVERGAVLARLDAEQSRAQEREASAHAAAAKAEAARTEADLKRTRELFEQEAATREAFEHAAAAARKASAGARAAEQNLREATLQRSETVLTAPFGGVIARRLHEPGDMGLAGEPIVVLHDPSALRLEASVTAACAGQINVGDPATVRIDALKASLDAKIGEIVPAADPLTGTVLIKADLPQTKGLQPGLFGWLEQACGSEHTALLIPAAALRRIGQVEAVTVLEGDRLSTRQVRSGFARGEFVEILSGLDEGETVVVR